MELFDRYGCLTDEGLQALVECRLNELARLEAAEHLAYCDRCVDRYTALLLPEVLHAPPASVASPVMKSLWVRIMRNTLGRAAVAGVAAVLALTLWGSGGLQRVVAGANRIPAQRTELRPNAVVQMWNACDQFVEQMLDFKFARPHTETEPAEPTAKLHLAADHTTKGEPK